MVTYVAPPQARQHNENGTIKSDSQKEKNPRQHYTTENAPKWITPAWQQPPIQTEAIWLETTK